MLFKDISTLLRDPVGNNLKNNPDDVENLKRKFKAIDRYGRDVENGYIDRDLNDAIFKFQKERGLKVDGRMNPGGETETTLINTLLGLDRPVGKRPAPVRHATRSVPMVAAGAAPMMAGAVVRTLPALLGLLGGMIGLNTDITPTETGEDVPQPQPIPRPVPNPVPETPPEPEGEDCEAQYESDTADCNGVTESNGPQAGAVCHQSASDIYAACLRGWPREDWPPLQI